MKKGDSSITKRKGTIICVMIFVFFAMLGCDGASGGGSGIDGEGSGAGDSLTLVISEIMKNPSVLSDSTGEWFEIYNPTGSTFNLNGMIVSDNETHSFTINTDLNIGSRGFLTFANSNSPGFTPNYVYSNFTLLNANDSIILTMSGNELERVEYTDTNFPNDSGKSLSLNPSKMSTAENDTGSNWSSSTSNYGSGDFGTPGAVNDN